ncbi:hypothetical protein EYF80_021671 [Liparis tanakae]|uniref:Uncharacterized protein n=1 Tax=Liparis tanakae TaxID=230148 RepID=A0A4Z2HR17_9TELE|nr:hypothetical protein EYF80_021671 [Liparis tanakae]
MSTWWWCQRERQGNARGTPGERQGNANVGAAVAAAHAASVLLGVGAQDVVAAHVLQSFQPHLMVFLVFAHHVTRWWNLIITGAHIHHNSISGGRGMRVNARVNNRSAKEKLEFTPRTLASTRMNMKVKLKSVIT